MGQLAQLNLMCVTQNPGRQLEQRTLARQLEQYTLARQLEQHKLSVSIPTAPQPDESPRKAKHDAN